jgi:hypothetical protein
MSSIPVEFLFYAWLSSAHEQVWQSSDDLTISRKKPQKGYWSAESYILSQDVIVVSSVIQLYHKDPIAHRNTFLGSSRHWDQGPHFLTGS